MREEIEDTREIKEKETRRDCGHVPQTHTWSGTHDWGLEGRSEDLETVLVENEKKDCPECLPLLVSLLRSYWIYQNLDF